MNNNNTNTSTTTTNNNNTPGIFESNSHQSQQTLNHILLCCPAICHHT